MEIKITQMRTPSVYLELAVVSQRQPSSLAFGRDSKAEEC